MGKGIIKLTLKNKKVSTYAINNHIEGYNEKINRLTYNFRGYESTN